MKRFAVLLIVIALFAVGVPSARAESYRIIIHPDNPTVSLSKKKLSRLLLKEVSRWDDNDPVQPVDQESDSLTREEVTRDIHGRSVASIKNFWQRQIFSGNGVPPPEVSDDQAVIEFVRSRPGGIGYVSASARLDGVKELTIAN